MEPEWNQNGTHWANQKIHQQGSSPKLRVVLLVTQLPFLQRFNVKHEHLVHLVVVHRASSEQFILLHKGAIFLRGRPPISNDVPRKHQCVVKPRNTKPFGNGFYYGQMVYHCVIIPLIQGLVWVINITGERLIIITASNNFIYIYTHTHIYIYIRIFYHVEPL